MKNFFKNFEDDFVFLFQAFKIFIMKLWNNRESNILYSKLIINTDHQKSFLNQFKLSLLAASMKNG